MSRHYKKKIDGDEYKFPSVTTIISDCTDSSGALTQWAANMVAEYMKEHLSDDPFCPYKGSEIFEKLEKARFNFHKVSQKALDIGSEVHKLIEEYLKDPDNTYIKKLKFKETGIAFEAFLDWMKEVNLQPIKLEQTVWGDRWAGTLDFYGIYRDKLYVIDWKTSKPANKKTGRGVRPEMRYQVAAYRWAMNEQIDWINDIDGCGVLRLDKETGMPDWNDTSKTYEQDLRVFNRMVDLYFERHPRIRKKFDSIVPF